MELMNLIGYCGLSMTFFGVTGGDSGQMGIIETPDDMFLLVRRINGNLCMVPQWQGQKEKFGYVRKLRYVFFDKGGYVSMCKRYRAYAKGIGKFKTLAEKKRENPAVDLLVGAVNIWSWDHEPVK